MATQAPFLQMMQMILNNDVQGLANIGDPEKVFNAETNESYRDYAERIRLLNEQRRAEEEALRPDWAAGAPTGGTAIDETGLATAIPGESVRHAERLLGEFARERGLLPTPGNPAAPFQLTPASPGGALNRPPPGTNLGDLIGPSTSAPGMAPAVNSPSNIPVGPKVMAPTGASSPAGKAAGAMAGAVPDAAAGAENMTQQDKIEKFLESLSGLEAPQVNTPNVSVSSVSPSRGGQANGQFAQLLFQLLQQAQAPQANNTSFGALI